MMWLDFLNQLMKLLFLQAIFIAHLATMACVECEYHYCVDGEELLLHERLCNEFGYLSCDYTVGGSADGKKSYELSEPEDIYKKRASISCSCTGGDSVATLGFFAHEPECHVSVMYLVSGYACQKHSNGKSREQLFKGDTMQLFQLIDPLRKHFTGYCTIGGRSCKEVQIEEAVDATMHNLNTAENKKYSVFMPSVAAIDSINLTPGFVPVASIFSPQVVRDEQGVKKAIAFDVDFEGYPRCFVDGKKATHVTGKYCIDLKDATTSTTLDFPGSKQKKILGSLKDYKPTQPPGVISGFVSSLMFILASRPTFARSFQETP